MRGELKVAGVIDHSVHPLVGIETKLPEGYIPGMYRGDNGENKVTHLYKGTFGDPGLPMCKRGWNDPFGGYSIFRNNISKKGICRICWRRALKGLDGVE